MLALTLNRISCIATCLHAQMGPSGSGKTTLLGESSALATAPFQIFYFLHSTLFSFAVPLVHVPIL